MKLKNINIAKILQTLSFGLLAIMLFFWGYIEKITNSTIPFTTKEVMGIIIGIMGSAFLYFDEKVNKLMYGKHQIIEHMPLNETISLAANELKYVDKMLVFALDTRMIQPFFSSSNLQVNECQILVYEETDINAIDYNNHIDRIINEWRSLEIKGRIKKLTVKRYNFTPTHYYVIFDEKILVQGLYYPNKDIKTMTTISNVDEPIIVRNSSNEGRLLIKKFIEQYKNLFLIDSLSGE